MNMEDGWFATYKGVMKLVAWHKPQSHNLKLVALQIQN